MDVALLRVALRGVRVPCLHASTTTAVLSTTIATTTAYHNHYHNYHHHHYHRSLSTHSHALCCKARFSKVPQCPVSPALPRAPAVRVGLDLVQLLERLSLVDFANQRGVERLQEAISLADQLSSVDTTGVEPMITVLEDRCLPLGCDVVECDDGQKDALMTCAHTTLDGYFTVPPGNITFQDNQRSYHTTLKHHHHHDHDHDDYSEQEEKEEERGKA